MTTKLTSENCRQVLQDLAAPFKADEVEWRIGTVFTKRDGTGRDYVDGATCFVYLTRVAVQQRLDDVVGPENWRCEFREWQPDKRSGKEGTPSQLCGLSIRINDEWITKWDGAQNTDIEGMKGGISDSFKRAANCWGVGRYLYRLEQGRAVIQNNNSGGATYASHKMKDSNSKVTFYWKPPRLPEWALPTGDSSRPRVAESVKEDEPTGNNGQYQNTIDAALAKEIDDLVYKHIQEGAERAVFENMYRAAKRDPRYNNATREHVLRIIAEAGQQATKAARDAPTAA